MNEDNEKIVHGSKGELDDTDGLLAAFTRRPVDRFGTCPNNICGVSWDGGDILEHIKRMDVFFGRSEQDLKILAANAYGYDEFNPKHFSLATMIKIVGNSIYEYIGIAASSKQTLDPHFIQCPNCKGIWEAETGREFENMVVAKKHFYDTYSQELPEDTKEEAAK